MKHSITNVDLFYPLKMFYKITDKVNWCAGHFHALFLISPLLLLSCSGPQLISNRQLHLLFLLNVLLIFHSLESAGLIELRIGWLRSLHQQGIWIYLV